MTSLTTFVIVAPLNARAEGYFLGVKNPSCPVSQFSKDSGRFKKTRMKLGKFAKARIAGKRLPQADQIVVFMLDGKDDSPMFAVASSCVSMNEVYTPKKSPSLKKGVPEGTATSNIDSLPSNSVPFANRMRAGDVGIGATSSLYLTTSFMTWQEEISISRSADDPGGALDMPALVTAAAVCPGIGMHLFRTDTFEMNWDSCASFGVANLGLKEEGTGTEYKARNVVHFGLFSTLGFLFSHSETLAIGIETGLAYRKGQWPDPPEDNWTATSRSSIFPIYMLSTHWRGEDWSFVQKIGLLKTWPGYYWSLQVNRNF